MKNSIIKLNLLNDIDIVFADYICTLAQSQHNELWILASMLSWSSNNGNSAFDLNSISNLEIREIFDLSKNIISPNEYETKQRFPFFDSKNIAKKFSSVIGSSDSHKPIIFDGGFFALHKFYLYEKNTADFILKKIRKTHIISENIISELNRLFPNDFTPSKSINYQKISAFLALKKDFIVINGGPGTGKTTTVGKIISLLLINNVNSKIKLLAPTGKASDRLNESIRAFKVNHKTLLKPDLIDKINENAETIHRFLAINSYKLKFSQMSPAPYDVIIVDEASMVSLPLFSILFDAAQNSKIILIGDKDQLTAIENGDVLNDLTNISSINKFSSSFSDFVKSSTNNKVKLNISDDDNSLNDFAVQLEFSWRFSENSGISKVSQLVKNIQTRHEAEELLSILKDKKYKDINFFELTTQEKLFKFIKNELHEDFSQYSNAIKENNLEKAFYHINNCKILSATNNGLFGIHEINYFIERLLFQSQAKNLFYHGKPIMITENDYRLGLYNGDIGIIFRNPEKNRLELCFKTENSIKTVLPFDINNFITAFSITIHKSQGSEFNKVLTVLPPDNNKILTRELLYTAITRAKNHCTIIATNNILLESALRKFSRSSALQHKLLKNISNKF